MIDNPTVNDNRNYNYSKNNTQFRREYPIIINLIHSGSTVIDFGCGDGSLLYLLKTQKNVKGIGYDISESGIRACKEKGIESVCQLIDQHHDELEDQQFDYAICNVTIQMVMYPEVLLKEMIRVAKYQIISFPNFAFLPNRIDMLINGRMPRPGLFGYKWYSTGHIHQFSIRDFHELLDNIGNVKVTGKHQLDPKDLVKNFLIRTSPNLFESIAIYTLHATTNC